MGDSGAMFRRDWSEKPNLAAYRDLVYGDWWTREQQNSDVNGQVALRAFHGRHQITVRAVDGTTVTRRVNLGPEGRTLHVILHE